MRRSAFTFSFFVAVFLSLTANAQQVYFGNLHSHTSYSDGVGKPDDAYRYARLTARLDFLAVTEHSHIRAESGADERRDGILIARNPELYTGPSREALIPAAQRWTENGKFAGRQATAQVQQVPVAGVPLVGWVASRPHALPDTLADFRGDPNRAAQFRALLGSLTGHNWEQALMQARALAYLLVVIREAGRTFIIASDDGNAGRDPTIVINTAPRRDFIVQAPHIPFESGTAEQAAIFLRDLGGRAAIISGAHRCASRSFTACDGSTAVCAGTLQGYRDSDVGHNVDTLFHAAHVHFAELWPSSIIMSLHGMKEDNEGARTSLIVSSGIRADDVSQQTVATKLRAALGRRIKQPGAVVSCNLPADAVFQYRKLCGYTNVQGRHVNGDADACRASVDQGTGRFIHMEQDWTVLQPYAQSWGRIDRHAYNSAFMHALALVLPPVRAAR